MLMYKIFITSSGKEEKMCFMNFKSFMLNQDPIVLTKFCFWFFLFFHGGQLNAQVVHVHAEKCGFKNPKNYDRNLYNTRINNLKQRKSFQNPNLEKLPVVLTLIRDDNGSTPIYFDTTWVNWIFSKTNHYLVDIGARIYLADLRTIDNSSLYHTNETNNSVLVQDLYGPLGDPNAINVFLTNDSEGSFALSPATPLVPQAFVSINYINIQDDSETPEHEFGHLFGLLHTHEGTTYGHNSPTAEHVPRSGIQSNCDDFINLIGDYLCDTPADNLGSANGVDIYGNPYMPDSTNIMSYYLQTRNQFSVGQDSMMEDGLLYRMNDQDYDIQGFIPTTNPIAPVIDTSKNTHLYNYIGWNNVSDNQGYLIERSSVSQTTGFRNIYNGAVFKDVSYYYDRDIVPGTDYWYRVIPVNSPDQYSDAIFIASAYSEAYCEFITSCNTFTPDSVIIIDNNYNLTLYEEDFHCDPNMNFHVEQSIDLVENEDYTLSAFSNSAGQAYFNLFIDLNSDGDFSDQGEWVAENIWFYNGGVDSFSFLIPTQSSHGLKAGRVIFSTLYNLGQFQPLTSACDQPPMSSFTFDLEVNIIQNDCSQSLSLNGTQAVNSVFESSGEILSEQIIDADVEYNAGNFIELIQGFEVKLGSIFYAIIEGCGN